jgi:hypothetical protein
VSDVDSQKEIAKFLLPKGGPARPKHPPVTALRMLRHHEPRMSCPCCAARLEVAVVVNARDAVGKVCCGAVGMLIGQGDKIIQTRSYDCPQRFRAAWKTLLDQHIAAGRLRPSESAHASPAFIIPKADPTVLPCWVNGFRQLNLNTVPDNHPLP